MQYLLLTIFNQGIFQVAAAVLDWAKDNGASTYCHWFQPLGAGGVRHGQSAQVHQRMFEFDRAGKPVGRFKIKRTAVLPSQRKASFGAERRSKDGWVSHRSKKKVFL
jgi:glutamine synthetase type III